MFLGFLPGCLSCPAILFISVVLLFCYRWCYPWGLTLALWMDVSAQSGSRNLRDLKGKGRWNLGFLLTLFTWGSRAQSLGLPERLVSEGVIAKRREWASVGAPESEYELRRQPWLFCVRCGWGNSKKISCKLISHVFTWSNEETFWEEKNKKIHLK